MVLQPLRVSGGRSSGVQTHVSLCCRDLKSPHPDQIVRGSRECEHPSRLLKTAEPGLTLECDCLHPAEHFLNPFALALADCIAVMMRRPRVDCAAAVRRILRHVWSDADLPHGCNECACVIAAITAHSHAP